MNILTNIRIPMLFFENTVVRRRHFSCFFNSPLAVSINGNVAHSNIYVKCAKFSLSFRTLTAHCNSESSQLMSESSTPPRTLVQNVDLADEGEVIRRDTFGEESSVLFDANVDENDLLEDVEFKVTNSRQVFVEGRMERNNFAYYNAYCLANLLSNRVEVERQFPSAFNSSRKFGGSNKPTKRIGEKLTRLLSEVPLACFHFDMKKQFPTAESLRNWTTIVEALNAQGKLRPLDLPVAILGLSKISLCCRGKIVEQLGWDIFIHWVESATDGKDIKDNKKYSIAAQIVFDSVHRIIAHMDAKMPFDRFQYLGGILSHRLSEHYCPIMLNYIEMLHEKSEHDQSGQYCLELYKTRRLVMEAIYDVVCGLVQQCSLSSEMRQRFVTEFTDLFKENLAPNFDSKFVEKNAKRLISKEMTQIAKLFDNWEVHNASFWGEFFEFCLRKFAEIQQTCGNCEAGTWIKVVAIRLLRVRLDQEPFASNGEHVQFLVEHVKPFLLNNLTDDILFFWRSGELRYIRNLCHDCGTEQLFNMHEIGFITQKLNSCKPGTLTFNDKK